MSDATQGKTISGGLLLAIFLAIGALVSMLLVRSFENQLAAETDAFAADYAAEYADYDEAAAVESDGAAAGETAVEETVGEQPAPAE